jgi:cell wall-associated NlpC family hydrolase
MFFPRVMVALTMDLLRTTKLLAIWLIVSVTVFGCSSPKATFNTGNTQTDMVLSVATDLKGTPYCAAGDDPDCFDCSGFVSYCFAKAGITVPRTSTELYATGTTVDVSEMKPGDLIFFNTSGKGVSHVGIVVDAVTFIHSSTSSGVITTSMGDPYWNKRFIGVRRLIVTKSP